jgi:predicted  nucleic acid-binding Zn-ribbon protein
MERQETDLQRAQAQVQRMQETETLTAEYDKCQRRMNEIRARLAELGTSGPQDAQAQINA